MEIAGDADDGRVGEMIEALAMIRAYRRAAAEMPECAPGWLKMSQQHIERVRALSAEICGQSVSGNAPCPLLGVTQRSHG